MVGITTVSPHAVDESAPCLHVRSVSATSQRGCRRCSAQGFFEPLRTMCRAATRVTSSRYTRYRAVTRGTELLGLEVAQKRYSSGLPPALQVGDKIIFRPRMFGRISLFRWAFALISPPLRVLSRVSRNDVRKRNLRATRFFAFIYEQNN